MRRFSDVFSTFATLGLLAGLSACDAMPHRAASNADRSLVESCRQHADDVFMKQNRAYLTQRDTRDSPFSSTGLAGVTSAGLGNRYGRDEMVDDCVTASRNGQSGSGAPVITDTNSSPSMDSSAPQLAPIGVAR